MTIQESQKKAEELCRTCRYLYGGKGQKYTKSLVYKLAKQYPTKYTKAITEEALRDADRGFLAIDCSGFVCRVLGIEDAGSTQLKLKAVKTYAVKRASAKPGMVLYKPGHVAYIGEDLNVYEMRSTKADSCISKFEDRAPAFTNMLIIKGSPLEYQEKGIELYPQINYIGFSIVAALQKAGETDTSKAHRTRIAAKNGIFDYTGSAAQNLKMVKLLKEGKLKKC